MADVAFDYCCLRFMAGQRVPEQLDHIALRAYNEVFLYGKCQAPKLTKPAQSYAEARREISQLVEGTKVREARIAQAEEEKEDELADVRSAFFAFRAPRYKTQQSQTAITGKRLDAMETELRVGQESTRSLMHVHSDEHYDNLTVMRMRMTGHGCLRCAHCKNLSKRMARLEEYRYKGECVACLSPAELAATRIPDEYNNALLDLKIVKQRKERIHAENEELSKVTSEQLALLETIEKEIDGLVAERDNLLEQSEAITTRRVSQRRRQ